MMPWEGDIAHTKLSNGDVVLRGSHEEAVDKFGEELVSMQDAVHAAGTRLPSDLTPPSQRMHKRPNRKDRRSQAPLAQLVEQLSPKQPVPSSTLGGRAEGLGMARDNQLSVSRLSLTCNYSGTSDCGKWSGCEYPECVVR